MNTEIELTLRKHFPKDVSNKILEYGTAMTFKDQMRYIVDKQETKINTELKEKFKKYFQTKFDSIPDIAKQRKTSLLIYHFYNDTDMILNKFNKIYYYFTSINLCSYSSIKLHYPTIKRYEIFNLVKKAVEEINQSYRLSIDYNWDGYMGVSFSSYSQEVTVSW